MRFEPKRVLIEKEALEYPLGDQLYQYFKKQDESPFPGT